MVIEYETSKYVTKKQKIEIEDTKNVFLQGVNPYDGLNTYFGIWTDERYLIIATLTSNRNISYSYSVNKNVYTNADIRQFLKFNHDIKIITKNEFKEQLQKAISIIKI